MSDNATGGNHDAPSTAPDSLRAELRQVICYGHRSDGRHACDVTVERVLAWLDSRENA